MTLNAAMAAALNGLTEALDDPDTDIAHSLQLLTLDAAAAVRSFRGLRVVVPHDESPLTVTLMADGAAADDIRTSLHFRLPGRDDPTESSTVVIILYAGHPGAFVDLAADLAWLTKRSPGDFILDQHVASAAWQMSEGRLHAASAINQAIGVLIGRGFTPRQAHWQLDVQAADNNTDRHTAARLLLAKIPTGGDDGHVGLT